MKRNTPSLAAALVAALALALPATGAPDATDYRKVDAKTGYGNCLFSPHPLSFQQEGSAAYLAARSAFSEGEDIHVRCYWPKPLASYKKGGKLRNELRDNNRYSYALVWIQPEDIAAGDREFLIQDMVSPDADESMDWDQQRFDLYEDDPGCDVKVKDGKLKGEYGVTSANRCLSLANFSRKMQARFPALKDTDTFHFCFRQYVEVADTESTYSGKDATDKWRLKEVSTTLADTYPLIIAQSCFDYTLKG